MPESAAEQGLSSPSRPDPIAPGPGREAMRAVIVVELPNVTRDEFTWAFDQITRFTENWPRAMWHRAYCSLDEAVIEHVLREFHSGGNDAC